MAFNGYLFFILSVLVLSYLLELVVSLLNLRSLSPELPAATEQKETPPPGRRSVPASLTWVPGCGGLMMGGEAVLDLARRAKEEVK